MADDLWMCSWKIDFRRGQVWNKLVLPLLAALPKIVWRRDNSFQHGVSCCCCQHYFYPVMRLFFNQNSSLPAPQFVQDGFVPPEAEWSFSDRELEHNSILSQLQSTGSTLVIGWNGISVPSRICNVGWNLVWMGGHQKEGRVAG